MTDSRLKELSGIIDQLTELQKEISGSFGEQSEASLEAAIGHLINSENEAEVE